MYAELRPSSRPQRLFGTAATLIVLALLAFAASRPTVQTFVEPASEPVVIVLITPKTSPAVLPIMPLQSVDLPLPMIVVNLPEFETTVAPPTLTSLAPVTSPSASPRPSGNETLSGKPQGTGRTNGTGSILIPPVRSGTTSAPFGLKNASRSGLVTSLNFCVTDGGAVSDVQLAASSGFRDTDAIAVEWLEGQRFTPGTLDGVRARMCATYDVRWTYSDAMQIEVQIAAKAHAAAIRKRSRYPRQFVYWPQDVPFPGCDAVTICKGRVD